MVDCTSSEAGIQELLSMRDAILCSRVAVAFSTSRELSSSKTYNTWVLSSPKSFEILQDCNDTAKMCQDRHTVTNRVQDDAVLVLQHSLTCCWHTTGVVVHM